jgi:uncharacterized membrane protein required for colicin V production
MNFLGGLTWLDLGILLVGIVSLGIGFAQGMLRQIIGLAALYIAAILGAQYYIVLSNFIRAILFQPTSRFLNAIAFTLIVFAVWLLITWLAFDAYRSTKVKLFPLIDQFGGSVLGLVTMIVTLALILPVVRFAVGESWPGNETLRYTISTQLDTSRLVPVFEALKPLILSTVGPWLPLGLPSIFNL